MHMKLSSKQIFTKNLNLKKLGECVCKGGGGGWMGVCVGGGM